MSMVYGTFLCAGSGGQGIIMMGTLLAKTAMEEGRHVTYFPSYGPAMRGGTANCSVIVSDRPIASPVISAPQVLVAMNRESFSGFAGRVASRGTILYNSALCSGKPCPRGITCLPVNATGIAEELGKSAVANMVMLGAVARVTGAVSLRAVKQSIKSTLPAHKHGLLPVNYAALDRGYALY